MCDLDGVFGVLADKQRRHVIDCLQRHHVVSLPDLAEYVAEKESGDDTGAVSAERVRDVYFSLYHTQIPTLEEVDLAHYKQENDVVARTQNIQCSLVQARDRVNSLLHDS